MKLRGLRRNAPAILISAVAIAIVVIAFASNQLFNNMTNAVEQGQFQLMKSIFDSELRSAEGRAMARAEMMINMPTMVEIFAARDRERLLAEYGMMFKVQKEKYGVDQAQFHVPPATSFLRLQAPDTFGDDLTKFRPMVVAVNEDLKPRSGLAIARTGPAIFGVVPVFDKNKTHIGSFEVGIDFGTMLDSIKATYGMELALLIEEQPLRDFAKGVGGEVLSEQNRVGKFVKFHSTHWKLMKELTQIEDVESLKDTSYYSQEALGIPYGVMLVPLKNAAGNPLGIAVVAKDFSGSRAATRRSMVWQVSLVLFAILLLTGSVIIVLRGFMLRPLAVIGERFEALAEGDREQTIDVKDELCQELQVLVDYHEHLRTKAIIDSAHLSAKDKKSIKEVVKY